MPSPFRIRRSGGASLPRPHAIFGRGWAVMAQLLRFGLVGTLGFLVDAATLYVLLALGASYFWGRLGAFLVAMCTTWLCNRSFTFSASKRASRWKEWRVYCVAMSGGALINLGVSMAMLSTLEYRAWLPAAAVAAGSLAGMALNFISAKYWVFTAKKTV